ncbi:MAG: S-layer homology domain-containing protein [Anaerotignum sp.]|nr:S-layer homology domain-containing protein [Anaerotignum sp.]
MKHKTRKLFSIFLALVMVLGLAPAMSVLAGPTVNVDTPDVAIEGPDGSFDYTVAFNANGHGIAPDPQTVKSGETATKPAEDPTASGWKFGGWYMEKECNTEFDFSTQINGNITLFAKWTENSGSGSGSATTKYTLTYESNGGSKIAATKHVKNATVNLTATPTREGYDFTGWFAEADLTNKITSIKMDSNKTVYAGWEEKGEKPGTDTPGIITPDALGGDNHIAYVVGYPDGAFRPDRPVTRAETASMIYRLLKAERRVQIYTTTNHFSDVKATSWYNEAVSSMANGGYVVGYPDGTFGGGKNITRAEFVTMLVNFMGVSEGTAVFSDVKESHWAYKQIATASKGLVAGYPDGTFRPDQPITRAEAVSILNRILNRGVNETSRLGDFKNFMDNAAPSAWYYFEVIEAANSHEYEGRRPNENWLSIITN